MPIPASPVLALLALASADEPVTYSKDVAPILHAKCAECHRPGQIGPFSLLDYKDARRWRLGIAEVVEDGRMPPWHADPAHGEFRNDRSLSAAQRDTLLAWVEAGAPEGDPADLPPAPVFPAGGWKIGEPDAVFTMTEPYTVKADGALRYQFFRIPTNYSEDKYIRAMEVRPGNREVVHHILVFIAGPDGKMPEGGGARGGQLVGYAPGDKATIYPEGYAKKLPAGASLIFQVHYTPVGRPVEDQSSLAVRFADEPDPRDVITFGIPNYGINIRPGDPNYPARTRHTFNRGVTLLSLWPHMHLRGKDFTFTAVYPDGREEVLLSVPRYDFNWQTTFILAEPKRLPAGTRIECEAHYDNSASNPALTEEDTKKPVRWGEQTWDEMMIGYLEYVADEPEGAGGPLRGRLLGRLGVGRPADEADPGEQILATFEQLDRDGDGVVTPEEFPDRRIFERADLDGDGKITRAEAESVARLLRAAGALRGRGGR